MRVKVVLLGNDTKTNHLGKGTAPCSSSTLPAPPLPSISARSALAPSLQHWLQPPMAGRSVSVLLLRHWRRRPTPGRSVLAPSLLPWCRSQTQGRSALVPSPQPWPPPWTPARSVLAHSLRHWRQPPTQGRSVSAPSLPPWRLPANSTPRRTATVSLQWRTGQRCPVRPVFTDPIRATIVSINAPPKPNLQQPLQQKTPLVSFHRFVPTARLPQRADRS